MANNKKRILHVDDEPDTLTVVKKILEDEGFEVVSVDSGRETLKRVNINGFDLLILDIMMPDMDGWDVCEKIKADKNTEKIPIVFLTAKDDPVSKSMGSLASMDYVTKPFDNKDLIQRVKRVISK